MSAFTQLFLVNFKILYRNRGGLFWTLIMPAGLYIALSVLPIPRITGQVLYRDYVLPGVIAYTIMSSGIYGLAYWMTDMKARGVIKRFLVTPIRMRDLVLGLLASRVAIMFIQVFSLMVLGLVFFRTTFTGSVPGAFLLVVLGGGIFLLVGLLIANYASSYESAAPLTAALGMPMAFLGNVFFPTSGLPAALHFIASVLPITYLAEGLRKCFIQSATFLSLGKELFFLALWFVVLLAITVRVFKLKE